MWLYPGMSVAQLAFEEVEAVATGYSGKYVGQQAPAVSRFHENWVGRWT
jgi:deoxycytidine triphosphate deaminase